MLNAPLSRIVSNVFPVDLDDDQMKAYIKRRRIERGQKKNKVVADKALVIKEPRVELSCLGTKLHTHLSSTVSSGNLCSILALHNIAVGNFPKRNSLWLMS